MAQLKESEAMALLVDFAARLLKAPKFHYQYYLTEAEYQELKKAAEVLKV